MAHHRSLLCTWACGLCFVRLLRGSLLPLHVQICRFMWIILYVHLGPVCIQCDTRSYNPEQVPGAGVQARAPAWSIIIMLIIADE